MRTTYSKIRRGRKPKLMTKLTRSTPPPMCPNFRDAIRRGAHPSHGMLRLPPLSAGLLQLPGRFHVHGFALFLKRAAKIRKLHRTRSCCNRPPLGRSRIFVAFVLNGYATNTDQTPSHLVRAHAAACSDLPAGPPPPGKPI